MFKMVFGNRAALARIIIWKAGGNQNHLPYLRISSLLGSQNHYCHLRRPFLIRLQFIDLPVVDKSKQNTPHFTGEVITGILRSSNGYQQMFCALLGGAGLRVGGAMELEIDKHISKNFRTLYIRQKVRRGKLENQKPPVLRAENGGKSVALHSQAPLKQLPNLKMKDVHNYICSVIQQNNVSANQHVCTIRRRWR
jgi:hypothetical protein